MERVLIVPIAGDLRYTDTGVVVCGKRTQESCDHAKELLEHHPNGVILLSPGCAGPQWGNVHMADVMLQYFKDQVPDTALSKYPAPVFNTRGEVIASVEFASYQARNGMPFSQILYATEVWRAKRVRQFIRLELGRSQLDVLASVCTHGKPSLLWEIYEFCSRYANARRERKMLYA